MPIAPLADDAAERGTRSDAANHLEMGEHGSMRD
jgi:hypothetical protein